MNVEAVRGQREDVIERQRRDDDLAPAPRRGTAGSRRAPAACWRRCCGAAASRPWRRRSCRRCTAGTRCRRVRSATRASVRLRPSCSASDRRIAPGSEYAGTIFFTCRSTKSTMMPLKPSSSPIDVTIVWRTFVLPITSCERAREVLEHDDHFGAGVVQLVLELARRVQRIDVDHRAAGAQRRRTGRPGIAGCSASSARRARPCRTRCPADRRRTPTTSVSSSANVIVLPMHVNAGRAANLPHAFLEHLAHRRVLVDVDRRRHALRDSCLSQIFSTNFSSPVNPVSRRWVARLPRSGAYVSRRIVQHPPRGFASGAVSRLRLRVVQRPAAERREAGAEDRAGVDQIRIGDDAIGKRRLRLGDERPDQTVRQARRNRPRRALLRLARRPMRRNLARSSCPSLPASTSP